LLRLRLKVWLATGPDLLIGILLQQLAVPRRHFRREAKAVLLELVHGLTGKK
jgi:hypothetical protein